MSNDLSPLRSRFRSFFESDDRENYSAVERKEFRDDSPSSRNVKDTNTVKEQNVFEKTDWFRKKDDYHIKKFYRPGYLDRLIALS